MKMWYLLLQIKLICKENGSKYKAQKRWKGVVSQNTIEDDFVESIESASNLDTLWYLQIKEEYLI